MKILLIGGTGAIGKHLVNTLQSKTNDIYVTTRNKSKQSDKHKKFITGNGKDPEFLDELIKKKWDVIYDFMVYENDEFKIAIDKLLSNTEHYFYISSSRVYSDNDKIITEKTKHLIDVVNDDAYKKIDEYAKIKSDQEKYLNQHEKRNWTIVRPYISYSEDRLQLANFEKEDWLYRLLKGKTILFPKSLLETYTTLTYAKDVAYFLSKINLNEKVYGESFHITSSMQIKWKEVLQIYEEFFEDHPNIDFKIKLIDDNSYIRAIQNKYQFLYDRAYNRIFSDNKSKHLMRKYKFLPPQEGLRICLSDFLKSINFRHISVRYEAKKDSIAKEKYYPNEFKGLRNKIIYFIYRFIIK